MARLGNEKWEVEWLKKEDAVFDSAGDPDPYNSNYSVEEFKSLSAAEEFARKVLPECFWGAVQIRHFIYMPLDLDPAEGFSPFAGQWEQQGELIEVS